MMKNLICLNSITVEKSIQADLLLMGSFKAGEPFLQTFIVAKQKNSPMV